MTNRPGILSEPPRPAAPSERSRPAALAELSRPARLRPGARVAIVAPSGPVPEDRLEQGLDILRGWDLDPVVMPHVLDRHGEFGYLGGGDAARARDLTQAWCDPSVAAVLCARGGYGVQRMVDLVDWTAMRTATAGYGRPKAFVGYSDITALHGAFAVRMGVATLHGPMTSTVSFLKDGPTQDSLRATLFAPETVRTLGLPTARTLVPGRAHGVTLGGCVSLLAADLGTPHARPSARGGILVIEDVGEAAYRLDRNFTQLLRSGWLDGVAGIALGSWVNCGSYAEEIRPLLLDRLGGLGVPMAEELGFGHSATALTVPLGASAVLDADAGTLTVDAPALV